MSAKREASVLRDDLSELFEELAVYCNFKNNLLEKIIQNEINLRYLVKSDNADDLSNLLQADNDLFVQLDAVEFDIQSAINKICNITGLDRTSFENYFKDRSESIVKKVFLLIKNAETYMLSLMKDRDSLIEQMEEKLNSIQEDMSALKFIRKLKH